MPASRQLVRRFARLAMPPRRARVGADAVSDDVLRSLGINPATYDPAAFPKLVDAVNATRDAMQKAKLQQISNLEANAAAVYITLAPVFPPAALVAAPIMAFFESSLESLKWMIKTFGVASGGAGVDPPSDPSDLRWWHFETGSGARPDMAQRGLGNGWGPLAQYLRNPYELWILNILAHVVELQENGREFAGFDGSAESRGALVLKLTNIWNAMHASAPEDRFYPGAAGFHEPLPPGAFGPLYSYGPQNIDCPSTAADGTRGWWVHEGLMTNGPLYAGGLHGALASLQSGPPALQRRALQVAPMTFAIAEPSPNAKAALAACRSWLTHYGVS